MSAATNQTGAPLSGAGVRVVHGASVPLAAELATWLDGTRADPFSADVVCVPSAGVQRWLTQQLAQRFGVCAAIDFQRLDGLCAQVLTVVAGVDDLDPWDPGRLIWSVLDLLDEIAARPDCRVLQRHIAAEHTRRYVVAEQAARHLHRYATLRPGLMRRWTLGDDVDAAGKPLDDAFRWQAHLWRALQGRMDVPDPAQRLISLADDLRADPQIVDVPPRLAVWSPDHLTALHTTVLEALGQDREVVLWLPHSSPQLWHEVADRWSGERTGALPSRDHDPTATIATNPLLARLGRDSRELQCVVEHKAWPSTGVPAEDNADTREETDTLLARVQDAIRRDEAPEVTFERSPEQGAPEQGKPERGGSEQGGRGHDDDSVMFHRCHGLDRQVEVLREVLLGLLADDPTLEPRDIIVQCANMPEVAPLAHAVFTAPPEGSAHPGQALPVRLADHSLREVNPVLHVLASVLELTTGRASRSDLLDLCAAAPVARRFGWGREGQFEALTELIDAAGVNWGIDATFRSRFRVGTDQNTWASARDRLLLSLFREDDDRHTAGTAVPVEGVESNETDLVGHFAEFVDRVANLVDTASAQATAAQWVALGHRIIDELTAVAPDDSWQIGHAHGVLADISDTRAKDTTALLRSTDAVAMLSEALSGRPTRSAFGTGAITICTLAPMRQVPHRAVVLLGLDDGVFPRAVRPDGDDLVAVHPQIGDPDPRAADRQAFLDAIMSARQRLVVIHSGFDERTNQPVAAAPPVQDLLDTCVGLGADPAVITRRHPLQSHGESDLCDPPFSFDEVALASAEAARTEPLTPARPVFDDTPLPALEHAEGSPIDIELSDLLSFFRHPGKHYLRARGGISTWQEDEPSEQLPLESDGLDIFQVSQRLLRGLLAGVDADTLLDVERRRGAVPPRAMGSRSLELAMAKAENILRPLERHRRGPLRTVTGQVEIGRFRLSGTVGDIHERCIVSATPSTIRGKRRLQGWINLLALTTFQPEPWEAAIIGSQGSRHQGPVAESTARAALRQLLEIHWQGLHRPVLWPPDCGCELIESGGYLGHRSKMYAHDETWQMLIGPARNIGEAPDFTQVSERVITPMLDHERKLS